MTTSGTEQDPAPKAVGKRDVEVLVGWAAILEGEITTGSISNALRGKLRRRVVDVGLLTEDGSERDFLQAINDLNHRLRYSLGEYAEPPRSTPLP